MSNKIIAYGQKSKAFIASQQYLCRDRELLIWQQCLMHQPCWNTHVCEWTRSFAAVETIYDVQCTPSWGVVSSGVPCSTVSCSWCAFFQYLRGQIPHLYFWNLPKHAKDWGTTKAMHECWRYEVTLIKLRRRLLQLHHNVKSSQWYKIDLIKDGVIPGERWNDSEFIRSQCGVNSDATNI